MAEALTCHDCGHEFRPLGSWAKRCRPCQVKLTVALFQPQRVPVRVKEPESLCALTQPGFEEGMAVLASMWKMPANVNARYALFQACRKLSDVEFMDACRSAVANLDRRPAAAWLVESAAMRRRGAPVLTEPEWEYGWDFICHGCGYRFVGADGPGAPTHCRRCEGSMAVEAAW